ncbi:hypothetical protein MOD33_06045 [Bacillus spizizenii]|nr:hypothetical protein [Bacillus spizizenii]
MLKYKGKINLELFKAVKECINFLAGDIRMLDWTLVFYIKEDFLKEQASGDSYSSEDIKYILDKNSRAPGGATIEKDKEIHLFMFRYDFREDVTDLIHLIGNIYHELRHAWQYEHSVYEKVDEIKPDDDFEAYVKQPWETDAYLFQLNQMREHFDKILDILHLGQFKGIPYNYDDDLMNYLGAQKI